MPNRLFRVFRVILHGIYTRLLPAIGPMHGPLPASGERESGGSRPRYLSTTSRLLQVGPSACSRGEGHGEGLLVAARRRYERAMQCTLADPILMEVFSNRLLSVTEEMGSNLIRASFSTNTSKGGIARSGCSMSGGG